MARPIDPTPTLTGRDARRLAEAIGGPVPSEDEQRRRETEAKQRRKEAMRSQTPEATEESESAEGKLKAFTFSVPIKTVSEANMREHWAAKARRAKSLRQAGQFHTIAAVQRVAGVRVRPKELLEHDCLATVTLTRLASRRLDDDNLAGAFKAFRDGVADAFEIDDRDPRVRWRYDQRTSKTYGVEVTIEWGQV